MEIAPGIHLIPGTVGTRPLQLFLLRGQERTVLLDTGCAPDPERLIVPYLASLGLAPGASSWKCWVKHSRHLPEAVISRRAGPGRAGPGRLSLPLQGGPERNVRWAADWQLWDGVGREARPWQRIDRRGCGSPG